MFGRGRKKRRDEGPTGPPFGADTLPDLDETARFHVWAGYRDADDILELLVERVEYDPDTEDAFAADRDTSVRAVQEVLDRQLAAHAAAAAEFVTPTDPERLAVVFAELERDGILVGENRGYTQSDLRDDMWERLHGEPDARGWIGFHEQDTERAMHTGVLFLSFAHRSDQDADFALVAREVTDRLRDADFDVVWDDNPDARIELRGIRWQKRR